MRIGIDLMGSDNSPLLLHEAVQKASEHVDAGATFVVFATPEVIEQLKMPPRSSGSNKITYHVVSEVIVMSDEPLTAIRRKKNSSLVQGIRCLKKKKIDAFISTGNTGALIACASLSLPMLPNIKRPALLAVLPAQEGTVAVLDVGGNVSCKAHHLVQFAQMGAAYQRAASGIAVPKVGLLNIGVESKKGTSEVRQAYQVLSEFSTKHLEFLGNIEGREVFEGKVDVLVTDGFSGNVFLKTTEGVAAFIFDRLQGSSSTDVFQALPEIKQQFRYEEYPGAILCGIDGLVMKCHGNSSPRAIFHAIKGVIHLLQNRLIDRIKEQL